VLSLPEHASAADVLQHYEKRFSASKGNLSSIAISVNQEYARPEKKLHPGDEVALLPPVSGGATETRSPDQPVKAGPCAFITREPIASAGLLEGIKRPDDGAAVVFEGVVRNHSRGRRTIFLEYEAYEEMALKQMESLIAESRAQFQIRSAAIIHRLGKLEIGETSVVIIVASAHRAAAFDACRWLIDRLKRTVPIWKKEHFEDGAVWSDGEPFPEHITLNPQTSVVEARASSSPHSREATRKGSHSGNSASNPVAHK